MKKNIKTIYIPDLLELCPLKPKPIFKTTIVNSPNIISSKNSFIIKQYINTRDTDGRIIEKNIKFGKNFGKCKNNNICKNKNKIIYQKQGLNYSSNKNDSSILNNISSMKKNKYFINNNITSKNSIINYDKNKTERNVKANNKITIESYNYIYPKQKIKNFDNNNNLNNEYKNPLFEIYTTNKNERNKNKKNCYESKNDKANTYEKTITNKKSNVGRNSKIININNQNENSNYTTINPNATALNFQNINPPFRKRIIKNTNKNTHTRLCKQINSLSIDNKNTDKNNKNYISSINMNFLQKKNNLEANQEHKNINEKKNDISLPMSSIRHYNKVGENLSSPYLNDVLKNKKKDYIDNDNDNDNNSDYTKNRALSIPSFKTIITKNSLSKTSLRFLINRAANDKVFGESFHESYEKNKNSSVEKSIEKIKNADKSKNKNNINNNEEKTSFNEKDEKRKISLNNIYIRNKKRNLILSLNNNINNFNDSKEKDDNKKLLMNNIETIKSDNNNNTKERLNIIYERKHNENPNINKNKNKKNNNNSCNINQLCKTLNNFKPKKKPHHNLNSTTNKNKSNDNIFTDKAINEFDEEKEDTNNEFIIVSSIEPSKSQNLFNNNNIINIELLYNLENKILDLYIKTNKYQQFEDESFELINYYFKNDISKLIVQMFNSAYYKNIIISYIKIELLTYFLCYDICIDSRFDQIILLIKSIIDYIHNNFLYLIKFILFKYENNLIKFSINQKNGTFIEYLKNIIKQNLNTDTNSHEMTEGIIVKNIMENTKGILKYYKLIIENTHEKDYISLNNNNENDNDLKFPYCFKYFNNMDDSETLEIFRDKISFIISSFFIESYQLLNNYSIIDLEKFFYTFLDRKNSKIYKNTITNTEFILPKIDNSKYKYSLVLDLDETLIHCKNEDESGFMIQFRPGLIEFLKIMKNTCELILFSFGTSSYVESVVKEIEKNEKFFEYVLDRNHGIYDNGNCIKDLNMLNRDLKNVIIIDDTSNYFQLQEDNGICIKPFYGDIENDKNTLKVLARILEKIFNDANVTKDVRISLKKYKKLLNLSNIINN